MYNDGHILKFSDKVLAQLDFLTFSGVLFFGNTTLPSNLAMRKKYKNARAQFMNSSMPLYFSILKFGVLLFLSVLHKIVAHGGGILPNFLP